MSSFRGLMHRLPKLEAILQVYAVISVMLAAWTVTAFLWKLSAWLLLLNLGELVAVFSYAMAANLIESVSILLALLFVSMLLPARILRDAFAVRGSLLAFGLICALMAFVGLHMWSGADNAFPPMLAPVMVLLLAIVLLGAARQSRVRNAVHSAVSWASDRLMVFLFILVPLFVLSAVYVLLRNIG